MRREKWDHYFTFLFCNMSSAILRSFPTLLNLCFKISRHTGSWKTKGHTFSCRKLTTASARTLYIGWTLTQLKAYLVSFDTDGKIAGLQWRWFGNSDTRGHPSGLDQAHYINRIIPQSLPTQPSPSGLRAIPGGQMHMKVPIRFLHIMPLDSQSCSPSAHSSRSIQHI